MELVVSLALVAIVAAVASPMFSRLKQKNQLNDFARRALGDLRAARALGATGKTISGGSGGSSPAAPAPAPCPPPMVCSASSSAPPPGGGGGGGGDVRIHYGGIRISSTTSYIVFGDDDNIPGNGGERDITAVDFTGRDRSSQVHIVSPGPGTEIRFYPNGTRASGPNQIIIEDGATGLRRTITITAGGMAKFL